MTAFFIGLILDKLDMLHGWVLVVYIIYVIWRGLKFLSIMN